MQTFQTNPKISVRHLQFDDHEKIVDYFLNSEKDFLIGMGVDINKLPQRQEWLTILTSNYELEIDKKNFFYIIWLLDNKPVGHSNINKIVFAKEAFMHLHMWDKHIRKKGLGVEFLRMTLPYYFDIFKLETLFCEPFALNIAPNKTLEKLGFEFVKTYDTIPGWINSYQSVNRWVLTKEKFNYLSKQKK
ncbi:MAG TPA: GNAT family protein [Chitinophagaceae bacterium]|nr:GNAT family protein [Chitinophagaceae bacterium]